MLLKPHLAHSRKKMALVDTNIVSGYLCILDESKRQWQKIYGLFCSSDQCPRRLPEFVIVHLVYLYLLLTEFEGRTVSYGPSVFLLDLWPKREARGPLIEGEKTRIRKL